MTAKHQGKNLQSDFGVNLVQLAGEKGSNISRQAAQHQHKQ